MKAADLTEMLRAHYCPPNRQPSGLFATEIQSPDGRRRADALWMPLVSSAGDELVGHEIKVSRADVIVELQEPAKCDPWMRYCDRWWLVVAHGDLLIGLWDRIPDGWGVLAPPSGRKKRTMTVLRPAPALKPIDQSPGLQRLLAWSYYRARDEVASSTARIAQLESQAERYRQQLADLRDHGAAEISPFGRRAMRLLETVDRTRASAGVWTANEDHRPGHTVMDGPCRCWRDTHALGHDGHCCFVHGDRKVNGGFKDDDAICHVTEGVQLATR